MALHFQPVQGSSFGGGLMAHRVVLVLQIQQQVWCQGEAISEGKVLHGNSVFFQFECMETCQSKDVEAFTVVCGLELIPVGVAS